MTSLVPAHSVHTFGTAVVSPHELASNAGIEILVAGGNAVDAAIATNAVQGVVAPETCGIGGDLFALVHRPGQLEPDYLNASGHAGSGASAAALRDQGHIEMPIFHPATVTIPGCVDGWLALHGRYGQLPFARVLEPAIRNASEGFPSSTEQVRAFTRRADELMGQPSAAAMYPSGSLPVRGDRIVRRDLARTLQAIAGGGRNAFYGGEFGAALTAATNGWITPEDLTVPQADWQQPLGRALLGWTAWTAPPNTQGYLTLATLRIFEMLDAPTDPEHPDFWHLLIEAYRAGAWERNDLATDERTAPIAADELVSDERLAPRARAIRADRIGTWPDQTPASGGTAYMCAVDADGLAISLIQSNFHGLGSGIGAGETGVLLHNRGGGFTLEPGHPNELVPGRRPLHTLSPTLWTDGPDLRMILGTRGGHQQPQLLAQVAALHRHAGLDPAQTQAFPRWFTTHLGGDRSDIHIERRTPTVVADTLVERGHSLTVEDDWMGGWGPISVITNDETGLRTAAADPRVDTARAAAR